MTQALSLARDAAAAGEVPVGAVLVHAGAVIGRGFNRPVVARDPTAHAEVEALRSACLEMKNYRLTQSTLYVTLEPCVMCAGAILTARVERLVFGARDLRFGGIRSVFRLVDTELLNHRVSVEEGLLAADCAELLQDFFASKRGGKK